MSRFLANSQSRRAERHATAQRSASAAAAGPRAFHRRLPEYAPTPLHELPDLARELGVGALLVKDESLRLGLPAFKILGASWAAYQALAKRVGDVEPWRDLDELRAKLARARPPVLVTATDGNHGRAVAHVAKWLGLGAHVYLPADAKPARQRAIESEGARLSLVHGTYDDAVARASEHAESAGTCALLVQDSSWPGYEEIPASIADGYSTLFEEIDEELAARGARDVDLVLVQIGVGALAVAAARHFRAEGRANAPALVGVEPVRAACALESIAAGRIVDVPGPHDSIMAGLNCGSIATIAWPVFRDAFDAFVAVEDERAVEAVRALARADVVSGESGAAGLAGLFELAHGEHRDAAREALSLGTRSRVLVISTEGATDPEGWRQITGRSMVRPSRR